MDQQVMEAQPDSDADALAAFERMSGQLAMLTAAVEGFAARQARIEQRDYSQDLAQLAERQDKMIGAINILGDRPGVKLTPDGFAESVGRVAAKLRAPDKAALASAQAAMGDARSAILLFQGVLVDPFCPRKRLNPWVSVLVRSSTFRRSSARVWGKVWGRMRRRPAWAS